MKDQEVNPSVLSCCVMFDAGIAHGSLLCSCHAMSGTENVSAGRLQHSFSSKSSTSNTPPSMSRTCRRTGDGSSPLPSPLLPSLSRVLLLFLSHHLQNVPPLTQSRCLRRYQHIGSKGNLWNDIHMTPDERRHLVVTPTVVRGLRQQERTLEKKMQEEEDRKRAQVLVFFVCACVCVCGLPLQCGTFANASRIYG